MHLQNQPEYLVIENVVGFETSRTAAALRKMLVGAGYESQEFLLSPLQLGIPYSRPRYFCVARKVLHTLARSHLHSHFRTYTFTCTM